MAKMIVNRNGYTAIVSDHGWGYVRPEWDGKGVEPKAVADVMASHGGEIIPGLVWDESGTIPDIWSDEAKELVGKWLDGVVKQLAQT